MNVVEIISPFVLTKTHGVTIMLAVLFVSQTNQVGNMKIFKAYHKNSNVLKYKRVEFSDGYSSEYTYNEQGKELTFKGSDVCYRIRGKYVSKAEFEAFLNDDIIELNGVKYKRI